MLIMLNIAAHRGGLWEMKFLDRCVVEVLFTVLPHGVAVAPRLPRARVCRGARMNRGVPTGCGCGARADFSVTPRLGLAPVLFRTTTASFNPRMFASLSEGMGA